MLKLWCFSNLNDSGIFKDLLMTSHPVGTIELTQATVKDSESQNATVPGAQRVGVHFSD